MKSAGKARSNGLYRHIRTSKEIIRNLLNYSFNNLISASCCCSCKYSSLVREHEFKSFENVPMIFLLCELRNS